MEKGKTIREGNKRLVSRRGKIYVYGATSHLRGILYGPSVCRFPGFRSTGQLRESRSPGLNLVICLMIPDSRWVKVKAFNIRRSVVNVVLTDRCWYRIVKCLIYCKTKRNAWIKDEQRNYHRAFLQLVENTAVIENVVSDYRWRTQRKSRGRCSEVARGKTRIGECLGDSLGV